MGGNDVQPQPSVTSKVVAILRSFGSGGSLTVTEIAQVAGLPQSTAHRLVHELAGWGVLRRGDDARYEIVALSPLRGATDGPSDLRAAAAPVVEDLSGLTHSDVRLGLLDGPRVRYAEKMHGCQPLSAFSRPRPFPRTPPPSVRRCWPSPASDRRAGIRPGLRRYTAATITTPAGSGTGSRSPS